MREWGTVSKALARPESFLPHVQFQPGCQKSRYDFTEQPI
ncbi:hypothetical protein T08_14011 [Trichinella sp. T8]|nr:hypothetical protein T08_14011 [Trichinella sp. T8]